MTIFEMVRSEVTARQAAELYGMKFDRSGRGFCPWHDDGKHPALQFFRDGFCYCHSCHMSGDATALTAQMLGLPELEAAKRLQADFHLDTPYDKRPAPDTKLKAQQKRDAKAEFDREWGKLCEVVREADARLRQYTPETIDAEFDLILAAMCKANERLDLMWEEQKNGRT